ncbi:MAG TPA: hypothetical protein VK993_01720 [Chthoniobacterales bacterium]|nr:hypothetical protein [Chthoniobacterales bacterium]
MAEARFFVCTACSKTVEAWDDGNPYWIVESGGKHYAYHPDPDRDRCIGNDSPHLCLACGSEFNVDSRDPVDRCTACGSADIRRLSALDGEPCPWCKRGRFQIDPEPFLIC